MDGTDGITIALGATTTGFVVKELLAWLRNRNQRTEIAPSPLDVKNEKKPTYVTVGEFNTRLGKVEQDIKDLRGDIQTGNSAVIAKLDEIDQRSETRALELNRRIDPVIEKVAANAEAIGMMKDDIREARRAATIGGKK